MEEGEPIALHPTTLGEDLQAMLTASVLQIDLAFQHAVLGIQFLF
jgi:hypothetical protein